MESRLLLLATRSATLALCLLQAACTGAVSSGGMSDADQLHAIPVTDAAGRTTLLQGRVCRPAGDASARLVVIAHGSPPDPAARPRQQLGRCDQEAARWFLSRGYAVAFALRRGYGTTGGAFAEGVGACEHPNFAAAGRETARDLDAVVKYATALPFVRSDGAVVVGQSAGGWGAVAYDSLPHPKVSAFVSMAGGRGGHAHQVPNRNCASERLAEVAGEFGKTASTPMLWIYAENDSYFAPSIARAMHQSFTAAGGKAELVQPGPYDGDGHRLFFGEGGSAVWGPPVERYLAERTRGG